MIPPCRHSITATGIGRVSIPARNIQPTCADAGPQRRKMNPCSQKCCLMYQRWPKARITFGCPRWLPAPMATCWHGRRTSPAAAYTPFASRICARVPCCRITWKEHWSQWSGRRTGSPSSISAKIRCCCRVDRCTAMSLAHRLQQTPSSMTNRTRRSSRKLAPAAAINTC